MRRRVLMSNKSITDIVAGDILCAKEDGSKMVFDADDYADINGSGWTPIGVVVIPPSHDVYGTGEGAAVSLKWMNYNTPDSGSESMQKIYWGQRVTIIGPLFENVNNTNNSTDVWITYYHNAYLPSDIHDEGYVCITDPGTKYYNNVDNYVYKGPSPYLSDGSRNEDYYTTRYTQDITIEYTGYNAFSDFDGVGRTELLCSAATNQSNWRTASYIYNISTAGYSPAACCCWRYHTIGTNQGDWYLPAMGELGYLMVRLKTINNSINNIGDVVIDVGDISLWSSSERDNSWIWGVNTEYGYVDTHDRARSEPGTRSFIRF